MAEVRGSDRTMIRSRSKSAETDKLNSDSRIFLCDSNELGIRMIWLLQ